MTLLENQKKLDSYCKLMAMKRVKWVKQMKHPDWWWVQDDVMALVARALQEDSVAIIDGFLSEKQANDTWEGIKIKYETGKMAPGAIIDGKTNTDGKKHDVVSNTRGDHIGWFDEQTLPVLKDVSQKVGTLAEELKRH